MFINQDFNSILQMVNSFSTEDKCIEHLETLRRNGHIVSPFDSESKVYKCSGNKYRCKNTGKYFNVKTGTMFDNTKLSLQKRFIAIRLITSHKKGVSSLQLSRDLDVTQKTAWFVLQRIRNCFGMDVNLLDGDVEVDETYIGGKNKNRHKHKKVEHTQGRSLKDKTAVVGMIERGGNLIAHTVEDVQQETLTNAIIQNVKATANIYTDERIGYNTIKKLYEHSIVNHGAKEFVNGNTHTNTMEGFWSLLKRGVVGIYHFMSKKHLQMYIDEFVFRYNSRRIGEAERFNMLLSQCTNRLTYNQLINA